MAFIRDFEDIRAKQKELSGQMPAALQQRLSGGGGGGVFAAKTGGGSAGGRTPLLADYLRAAQGSKMSENLVGDLQKEGGILSTGKVTQQLDYGGKPGEALGLTVQTPTGSKQFGGTVKETLPEQQARQRAESLQTQARTAGQEGGAQSLLQQRYGDQAYTQGEQMLDAALLGATAGDRLSDFAKRYSDLYNVLSGGFQSGRENVDAMKDDERRLKEAREKSAREAAANIGKTAATATKPKNPFSNVKTTSDKDKEEDPLEELRRQARGGALP